MENNGMEEGIHWCNICSKMVNPMNEAENKCPICQTVFVEAMENLRHQNDDPTEFRSAWVFTLYAPIFLGLMSAFINPSLSSNALQESSSSRSSNIREEEEEVEQQERENENELVIGRRRRRASTSMVHLLGGLQVRLVSESENPENNRSIDNSILVIDPFNEGALIIRGPSNLNHTVGENTVGGSLNDFLVGSGFDFLLQHLAQNGPNGYASLNRPAQKAAIEAMPIVKSEENLQCTVCLENLEIGSEAKEMPCKHKFHGDCILSWLKLHSSCPVCRFQMPSEDSISTIEANFETGNEGNHDSEPGRGREERVRNGRRTWFPMLHPYNNLLPSP